jgi:two-component system nitrate/nitrite sensor histidine kinase NarQ
LIDAEAAALGGEIHDELVPLLFASSANVHRVIQDLDGKITPEDLKRLQAVQQWLADAMEKSREMINGVFPPDFTAASWSHLAQERLASLHPEQCDGIEWRIQPNATLLSTEVAFAALRISVEGCRNAIRHGRAETIRVDAKVIETTFVLSIQDNGVGFDRSANHEGHFGLLSMKQRADRVNGTFEIDTTLKTDSMRDHGTTLRFTSPVNPRS